MNPTTGSTSNQQSQGSSQSLQSQQQRNNTILVDMSETKPGKLRLINGNSWNYVDIDQKTHSAEIHYNNGNQETFTGRTAQSFFNGLMQFGYDAQQLGITSSQRETVGSSTK